MSANETKTAETETKLAGCPACNASRRYSKAPDVSLVPGRLHDAIRECRKCSGLYTTRAIYLGDSYLVVQPFMTSDPTADERQRYFDFETLGSEGLGRRHGWFDPLTKAITQVG